MENNGNGLEALINKNIIKYYDKCASGYSVATEKYEKVLVLTDMENAHGIRLEYYIYVI